MEKLDLRKSLKEFYQPSAKSPAVVDVPELRYFTTDRPYPRGELRVRGRLAIAGYLGDPEASRDLYDDGGYLRTGDIVEQRGPAEVVWIARIMNERFFAMTS